MANTPLTRAQMEEALAAWEANGKNMRAAAKSLGVSLGCFKQRYYRARDQIGDLDEPDVGFEVEPLPSRIASAEELRDRRRAEFARTHRATQARELIRVTVTVDGPIGIAHFGDPHLDDPGSDMALLERHVETVKRTSGLFAGNVGDTTNNWPRRSALAYLHSDQSTTHAEAWELAKWFLREIPWLYLVGGNHDAWSGADDPIRFITEESVGVYEWYGARLALTFPNGREVRVNCRHDFHGHSMWNTVHGAAKAATMGWRDHILTCGHKHTSGYQVVKDPSSGLVSHAIRVASYKRIDTYAESKGLPNQSIFVCPVTIIDPTKADDDPSVVQTIFDPETGADYLRFMRKKARLQTRRRR